MTVLVVLPHITGNKGFKNKLLVPERLGNLLKHTLYTLEALAVRIS